MPRLSRRLSPLPSLPFGLALAFLGLVAACGPMPLARAEEECLKDARNARAPTGRLWAGIGQGGQSAAGGEITISSDFLLGRDPSEVFTECVKRRAGKFPSRDLQDMPGWTR